MNRINGRNKYGYDRELIGDPLPKRFDKRYMWKTAKGEIMRAQDFYTDHLTNTINMLEQRNEEINDSDLFLGAGPQSSLQVSVEERFPIYNKLVKELERREDVQFLNRPARRARRSAQVALSSGRCPSCGKVI